MGEFIGSQIELISKSNIRYVGILYKIDSEAATVTLRDVQSYGTEGRISGGKEEIEASDEIYDYIVFRGSDVKDLSLKKKDPPRTFPNDPAIVGAGPPASHRQYAAPAPAPTFRGPANFNHNQMSGNNLTGMPPTDLWGQHPHPQSNPHPPLNMAYSWHPATQVPNMAGSAAQFSNSHPPIRPKDFGAVPNMHFHAPRNGIGAPENRPVPIRSEGDEKKGQASTESPRLPTEPKSSAQGPVPIRPEGDEKKGQASTESPRLPTEPKSSAQGPVPIRPEGDEKKDQTSTESPRLPTEPKSLAYSPVTAPTASFNSKPKFGETKATEEGHESAKEGSPAARQDKFLQKFPVTGPRISTRIEPAVPLVPSNSMSAEVVKTALPKSGAASATLTTTSTTLTGIGNGQSLDDATDKAKEAVANAMAKLNAAVAANSSQSQQADGRVVDGLANLTIGSRGMQVAASRSRGGRGRFSRVAPKAADYDEYDFQKANAKFKEAGAAQVGSPKAEDAAGSGAGTQPEVAYDKNKSFFDNVSIRSDTKNPTEGPGSERQKNIATFGEENVDGRYSSRRFRGYGNPRGRGRGGSTRGGYERGGYERGGHERGGYRGRGRG